MFVRKDKRGIVLSRVVTAIIGLVIIGVMIFLIHKFILSPSEDIAKVTYCGSVTGRQGRCVPEAYTCSEQVRGLGCEEPKPICCFDKRTYTFEEAKSIFKSEFPGLLNGCKDDSSVCDDATESLRSILLYTEAGDEGKVFVIIKRHSEGKTTFQLLKRQNWFSFNAGAPEADASFEFLGDTCILKSGKKDDEGRAEKKGEAFTYCVGKEKEGVLVGDCKGIDNGDVSIKGYFISIRHLVEDDPSSPVCIFYG